MAPSAFERKPSTWADLADPTCEGSCPLLRARVFRALWSRGLFVVLGSGFGADFLCYHGDPLRSHAHLLVHVAQPGRCWKPVELVCATRLAISVKKAAVLAQCVADDTVTFVPLNQRARKTDVGVPTQAPRRLLTRQRRT